MEEWGRSSCEWEGKLLSGGEGILKICEEEVSHSAGGLFDDTLRFWRTVDSRTFDEELGSMWTVDSTSFDGELGSRRIVVPRTKSSELPFLSLSNVLSSNLWILFTGMFSTLSTEELIAISAEESIAMFIEESMVLSTEELMTISAEESIAMFKEVLMALSTEISLQLVEISLTSAVSDSSFSTLLDEIFFEFFSALSFRSFSSLLAWSLTTADDSTTNILHRCF